jgi:hypothetical protein
MRTALLAAFLAAAASPAAAQPNPLATSGEGLGVTLAVQWTTPGVAVDFARRLVDVGGIRSLNVVGELHLKSGSANNDVSFGVGARLARHNQRMPSPFVQMLVGAQRERSSDESVPIEMLFRLQPGGGFNFRLPGKHLLRTQLDFPTVFFADDTSVYLRLSVGLEIHFGSPR